FYQFWLNVSDEDAEKYIRIFTFLSKDKVNSLIEEHKKAPHQRLLQKTLSKEVTIMVHSEKDYDTAIEASGILFGKATTEQLQKVDEETFLSVFEGVPTFDINSKEIISGISLLELLTEKALVFQSKGEMKRFIKGGGLSLNKTKIIDPEVVITQSKLLNNKYLLVQKGKKNYFLLKVIS
ncbi:MAG: tyrosine--tRNA ligase, partial [Bacteroidales bacterium]|nr:tyrosine--tRNA ligase [Bacteroidales bacterium]